MPYLGGLMVFQTIIPALFSLSILMALSSCQKDPLPLAWEVISTDIQDDLYAMETAPTGEVWIAGGISWKAGGVWALDPDGNSIRETLRTQKALLALTRLPDDRLIASGVDGHVWSSGPGGGWTYRHYEHWGTTRAIGAFTPGRSLFIGGEGFDEGFAYLSHPLAGSIGYQELLHRMNGASVIDTLQAVIVGYGIALRTGDAGDSWQTSDLEGDHFMSVHFPTPDTGFVAGYEGSIHRSVDGGRTWTRQRRPDGNTRFRCIRFRDGDTGFAAGEDGNVWLTRDAGSHWQAVGGLSQTLDFLCGSFSGDWLFLGGSKGTLVRTRLP